ncbi:hypothetical protein D3C72_1823420 [compost metagenome]
MAQAFKLRHQEGLAGGQRQARQHLVDLLQRFQDDQALFRRRGERLGHQRKRFQIRQFHRTAAMMIQQQALGDGGQVGARFAQGVQLVAMAQHPDERVLGQIGGIEAVAQLGAQPAVQPPVMGSVQKMNGVA